MFKVIYTSENKLIRKYESELLQIEAFGKNSFRVRVTHLNSFLDNNKALRPLEELPTGSAVSPDIQIGSREEKEYTQSVNSAEIAVDNTAVMTNGKIIRYGTVPEWHL